ncbi:MAG: hypothetical protein JRN08_07460 [Nitrososphaerota archaeon]|nr:hypothetical protein [Nitrososphaerota archaeon]
MNVYSDGDSYLARVSPDERSAILWAVEVALASLLRDRGLKVLLAEKTVTPIVLDSLADSLFLVGSQSANGR